MRKRNPQGSTLSRRWQAARTALGHAERTVAHIDEADLRELCRAWRLTEVTLLGPRKGWAPPQLCFVGGR